MNKKPQIIAFYLPQFYPTPENDSWWGKGFTEWTNVGKAKPLFKGHNQPRVPTELGYYDLRLPVVREQQAQMARDAGVTAFCYWHYWLGDGKRLLSDVFDEVLESGKPNFPFCLGWANHSWYAKDWNPDGTIDKKLLIEQTYPGIEDQKKHFDFLLKAFKDPRYFKVDGAPLLYIFDSKNLPVEYAQNLIRWTKDAGFPNLFLVAQTEPDSKGERLKQGYSAVSYQKLDGTNVRLRKVANAFKCINTLKPLYIKLNVWRKNLVGFVFKRPPFIVDYSVVSHSLIDERDFDENVIPFILPQWDHSPRSGWNGKIFVNCTPERFYLHVVDALKAIRKKSQSRQIIFLKSWNEWGEGNMMEPDLTYGRGFINALRKAVDEFEADKF